MKPILFSTAMVQAIMAGRKTQTRRLIKMPKDYVPNGNIYKNGHFGIKYESQVLAPCVTIERLHPPFIVGEELYVRETWQALVNCRTGEFHSYEYYADMPKDFHKQYPHKWKPSLFMPKAAARIFLEVTDVRAERLQDISEADAISEGIEQTFRGKMINAYRNYFNDGKGSYQPIDSFRTLWDSINAKKYPWDSNPWVWVYTFKKIENPHGK